MKMLNHETIFPVGKIDVIKAIEQLKAYQALLMRTYGAEPSTRQETRKELFAVENTIKRLESVCL